MDDEEVRACHSDTSNHELPGDIIVEILSRTTSKDLGRSNCVSKRWRDSLTIQAFKQRHLNSLDTVDRITVLDQHDTTRTFRMLSFEIPRNYIKNQSKKLVIEGEFRTLPTYLSKYRSFSNICHGLACIYNKWPNSLSDSSIVVYSTRTNDMLVFPTTRNNTTRGVFCFIGFGSLRKEYKIIRSTCTMIDRKQSLGLISYETLTLGSRTWNPIDNAKVPLSLLSLGWPSSYGTGLYLDGSIFWIQIGHQKQVGSTKSKIYSYMMVAFELNDEEFRVFDLDSILQESSFGLMNVGCRIAEIRGRPTVFAFKYSESSDSYPDTLVCAFSDSKMTSVAWSCTIAPRRFWIGPSVSESRIIVLFNVRPEYYLCHDLENDIGLKILIKN